VGHDDRVVAHVTALASVRTLRLLADAIRSSYIPGIWRSRSSGSRDGWKPGLEALAADPTAAAAFEKLSFSHRREYAQWIGEAKRAETRARRLDQTMERLRG
jgi:hypothetical protein